MRVLVTGASGFIGGHVVERLADDGHDVTAFVRPTSDVAHLRSLEVPMALGDVRDADSLAAACQGKDAVVHTAAVVGTYGSWDHFLEVGVRGTQKALDAAASKGVSRFVHLGSIAVYGTRPTGVPFTEDTPFDEKPERWNHYVREKVWSEKRVWRAHQEGKVEAVSIRPSVVLGPRDRNAIPRVLSIIKSPIGALSGKGDNRIPCVVVEELAEAIAKAMTEPAAAGRAYNFSGREPITQRQMVDAFAAAAGLKPLTRSAPEWVGMASARAFEGIYRLLRRKDEPYITRIAVALAGRDYEIDSSRAAAELGWEGSADYYDAIRRSVEVELSRRG
jgi:nucleoside-diphosphate-sugar epimerase